MASPLAQLISTSTSGYGGGYSPFAQVGQGAQGSSYTGQSAYNGPAGSIQEQAGAWNPYAQSNSNRINAWMAKQQAEQQAKLLQGQSPLTNNGGQVSSLGGDWAGVDQWNNEIGAAAGKYGVPANLMKALMKLESGGANLGRNGAGAIGPMQVVDTYWGDLGYDLYDPAQNIMAGAAVLKQNYDQYAGWAQQNGIDPWQAAIYSYYAGNPYNMNAADDPSQGGSGMSTADYGARIWADYQALNSSGGSTNTPTTNYGQWSAQNGANPAVEAALDYVGSAYVWGGIPGKGDPGGNWDCSGMTYWMDQNYGSGQLPAGSHYQFQYAQQTGQLFNNTAQLQPGDLLFWDTGNTAGGGAELNAAGHVGVYIGNGQMLHAANPTQGTIISSLDSYLNTYGFLGAMHSSYSGGSGGTYNPTQTGTQAPVKKNYWDSFMSHFS